MPLLVVNCSLGTSETGTLTVLLPISSVPMLCSFQNFAVCNQTYKSSMHVFISEWKINDVGFLQLLDRLKWA